MASACLYRLFARENFRVDAKHKSSAPRKEFLIFTSFLSGEMETTKKLKQI
jgi:hypothetical protein